MKRERDKPHFWDTCGCEAKITLAFAMIVMFCIAALIGGLW